MGAGYAARHGVLQLLGGKGLVIQKFSINFTHAKLSFKNLSCVVKCKKDQTRIGEKSKSPKLKKKSSPNAWVSSAT